MKKTSTNNNKRSSAASTSQPKSLPCKKMICTGVCTYRNRCHYIHDARIMNPHAKGTCRKKDKDEYEQKDLFYWTPIATTPGKEARAYSVPPSSCSPNNTVGGKAVASLWHHFAEICEATAGKQEVDITVGGAPPLLNPVTQRPRLSMFVKLGNTAEPPLGQDLPPPPARCPASEVTQAAKKRAIDVLLEKNGSLHSKPQVLPSTTIGRDNDSSFNHHQQQISFKPLSLINSQSLSDPYIGSLKSAEVLSRNMRSKYMPVIRDLFAHDTSLSGLNSSSSSPISVTFCSAPLY